MIVARQADAGDGHVAVPDGLDLFHPVTCGEAIELGDDVVEQGYRARCAEPLRELGETDEIAEQNRGLSDAVGDALPRACP